MLHIIEVIHPATIKITMMVVVIITQKWMMRDKLMARLTILILLIQLDAIMIMITPLNLIIITTAFIPYRITLVPVVTTAAKKHHLNLHSVLH